MAEEKTRKETVPSDYLDKPATVLQSRFADWVLEEVGYDPTTAKTKLEAFREGVRIATATRMVFQASDFNRAANAESQAANAAARAEKAAAKSTEEPKAAPAKKAAPVKAVAPAKKAAPKKAAAPVAEEAEADETPAPVRRRPARRAAATTAAAPF